MFPPELGNRMVKDPSFLSNMENYIKANKAEAAYFMELRKAAVFVLDMPSVDMMPVAAEPLFMLGAKVELHPAMNIEDLKKGTQYAQVKFAFVMHPPFFLILTIWDNL